ncbi:MAG TPA: hypothetical protein VGG19_01650 [Tepidisphaeraceae bacterium]|jgi:hypothetical protein
MRKAHLYLAAILFVMLPTWVFGQSISLAGKWRYALNDRTRWLGEIALPSSLTAAGIGEDISLDTPWMGQIVDKSWFVSPMYAKYREPGNIKIPFWLQPEKYFKGVAWYQREIDIPQKWSGKREMLFLERPHWKTQVWVDEKKVGENDSLGTPHEYELGQLTAGKHTLTVSVDNQLVIDIGVNSHAISDHTQGNWNGIVGKIELRALPLVSIDNLQIYPDVEHKSIGVRGTLANFSEQTGTGTLALKVGKVKQNLDVRWDARGGTFQTNIALGKDAKTWDEFSPDLYALTADLSTGDHREATFGLREIATRGTQFTINGRLTFMRGTLECCIFPETGHPPTDIKSWLRVLRIAESMGLNLIRFHSYCPPEAAFDAADQVGIYLQVETCWANQSTTLGDGKPVDDWVYRETDRILKYNGNHPSFCLMPYGNEPGGKNVDAYLAKYVSHYKEVDPRRLWTSGSGWPQLAENQFHITPDPRIQKWGRGIKSRINYYPPETETDYAGYIHRRTVPVISHEIGEWCVYPDFGEIPQYTGYLKPKNFEIFRDSLAEHHMADQAHDFLIASGKLQVLCYKEDIESALRTPGMGGFELLDVHDFPGQGTALVGVLNPFWREKGYVTAKEYRRFCNDVVPLARLQKRVFTNDEKLSAQIEVANFSAGELEDAKVSWKLAGDDGKAVAKGELAGGRIALGNGIQLGEINISLANVPAPSRYKLIVTIDTKGMSRFQNDWDVWVYPSRVDENVPGDITVVHDLDATKAALDRGRKVLLLIPPDKVANDTDRPVKLGFSSIFWNTAWTNRQAPTTLGILCDSKAALFANFPTDNWSDWQWWYLIHRASPMILDGMPAELHPCVQVIDDWVTNRKLGLAFEAKVGDGKLMVCSVDLDHADDPVTRQFRESLLKYVSSKRFDPKTAVTMDQLQGLIRK